MKPFLTESDIDRVCGFQHVKGSRRTIDICAHERAWWHVDAIDNTHHDRLPTLTASLNGWTADESKRHYFSNERTARQWFKQNKASLPAAEEALRKAINEDIDKAVCQSLNAPPLFPKQKRVNPVLLLLRRLLSHRSAFVEWFTSPFAPKATLTTLQGTGDPSCSFHPETGKTAMNLNLP